MGFQKIVLESESNDGQLPWATSFLEDYPDCNGVTYKVLKLLFGNKGVLIETDSFKAFFYRSNPYYDFLLEAANVWSEKNEIVCSLMFQLDSKSKAKGHVGIDDELESTWTKKGENVFTVKRGKQGSLQKQSVSNPLLKVPSKSASTNVQGKQRGKQGSRGNKNKLSEAAESLTAASNGRLMSKDTDDLPTAFYEASDDESDDV